MACLQSEFCTNLSLLSYEFSNEKCSEISPIILSLSFVGKKCPQKTHQMSLQKITNNSPTRFCRSAGRSLSASGFRFGRFLWGPGKGGFYQLCFPWGTAPTVPVSGCGLIPASSSLDPHFRKMKLKKKACFGGTRSRKKIVPKLVQIS